MGKTLHDLKTRFILSLLFLFFNQFWTHTKKGRGKTIVNYQQDQLIMQQELYIYPLEKSEKIKEGDF